MKSPQSLLLLASAASTVNAATLYAVSYSGALNTYSFTADGDAFSLQQTSTTQGCAPQPDWITLDDPNKMLYCLGESNTITAFSNDGGRLTQVQRDTTVPGAVSSVFFNEGAKRALAVAS